MVVEHRVEGIEGVIKTDYSKYFDKSWLETDDVQSLLKSDYMSNLNFYIYESYKGCFQTYPRLSKNIYRAFKETPLENVRVVMFADEPFTNVYSNGLAFGQMSSASAMKPKDSETLRRVVEKSYFDRDNVVFDTTLESWARQGVLLLNTSLISELASPNKHRKAFKNFTRQIIKIISDHLMDVVFVFTNKKQEEIFSQYIETQYHHIVQVDSITDNTDMLDEINAILLDTEGSESVIDWI